jgi:hypothetical protein
MTNNIRVIVSRNINTLALLEATEVWSEARAEIAAELGASKSRWNREADVVSYSRLVMVNIV